MPAKQIIPDHLIRRWTRQGLGPREIRDRLEREENIHVTAAAISMWRRRNGLSEPAKKYRELVPWRVRQEHANLHPVMMLRAEARRRSGEELPGELEAQLDRWLARLQAERAVVAYEPEVAPFWFYVLAEPGEDLIRKPD